MADFKPQQRNPGDLIKSEEWNAAMEEIARLSKGSKAQQVLAAKPGPMPVHSAQFDTSGGTLMVFISATGYCASGQQIGCNVLLDDAPKGHLKSYSNEVLSHKAFASAALVFPGLAAGAHKISLTPWNNTLSDPNDFYDITVLELPG